MENYNKILKCSKVSLIIAIIFAVIGALGISYSSITQENKQQEIVSKDYRELIANEQDVENEYVEVTITYIPYIFMKEEYDDVTVNYYFVLDQDNNPYIARLTDSTYTMLENKYKENPEKFSYKLKGYIFEYSEELKQLAILGYNQATQEQLVDNDNFNNYFGNTYLDEIKVPFYASDILAIGGGTLGIAIAPICLIIYIVACVKTRRILKKYDIEDLEYELSKTSTIGYKDVNIYLTDKYIISKSMGLNILEYNDVVWVYTEKRSMNLIPIGTWLVAFDKKRVYELAKILPLKKDKKIFDEIILKIREKNPNIMLGYTNENGEKYYKEIHNKI